MAMTIQFLNNHANVLCMIIKNYAPIVNILYMFNFI